MISKPTCSHLSDDKQADVFSSVRWWASRRVLICQMMSSWRVLICQMMSKITCSQLSDKQADVFSSVRWWAADVFSLVRWWAADMFSLVKWWTRLRVPDCQMISKPTCSHLSDDQQLTCSHLSVDEQAALTLLHVKLWAESILIYFLSSAMENIVLHSNIYSKNIYMKQFCLS